MEHTSIKIKLVVFSIIDDCLKILLKQNMLPQNVIERGVSLDEKVRQIFETATGITLKDQYIEQLYTTSSEKNINIAYYILLSETAISENKMAWKPLADISKNLPDLSIIAYAVQRLQWKIEYTNVVYSLLPEEFALSDLQKTYEAILGKTLDKRNFRKKIISLQFLEPTEKKRIGQARPAQMYRFKERKPVMVNIF